MMQQAREQLQDGRFEEAVETFSAALALRAREPEALRGRGLAHAQLQQWASAAADFSLAKDAAPEDPDNWIDWANSLAMDHQTYQAIDAFEALLARQPDCLRAHLELGRLYLRLGTIPKARQHLQQALTCRPTGAQRQAITAILQEQDRLDRNRYYRPDFEALNRQPAASGGWVGRIRQFLGQLSSRRTKPPQPPGGSA